MFEMDPSLDVACPTCGAAVNEKCELNSGFERFESHLERRDIAKDLAFQLDGFEEIEEPDTLYLTLEHPIGVA